jgi:hypothetical protein
VQGRSQKRGSPEAGRSHRKRSLPQASRMGDQKKVGENVLITCDKVLLKCSCTKTTYICCFDDAHIAGINVGIKPS